MVAVNEITTYKEGNMLWAAASEAVDVSADSAWQGIDILLLRIIEIPTVGKTSVKIRRVGKDVPLTHLGNTLVAEAAMLGGITKATMSMKITESNPLRYLRLAVNMSSMHFADIDFRIEPLDSGCQLTYRQGFRTRRKSSQAEGERVGQKMRELPETARIFNLWVDIAHASQ